MRGIASVAVVVLMVPAAPVAPAALEALETVSATALVASGPVAGAVARAAEQAAADALAAREIGRGDQSNIESLREAVVRRPADWQALWREHNFEQPPPRVDFAREMVIAVFLGSQTSAGYSVRISEVRSVGDAVIVRYQVGRPAAGGVAAQVLTFPYHIVAVPARPGNVRFERNLP